METFEENFERELLGAKPEVAAYNICLMILDLIESDSVDVDAALKAFDNVIVPLLKKRDLDTEVVEHFVELLRQKRIEFKMCENPLLGLLDVE